MEQQDMEKFFEKQKENWREKMTKVFGDHYPYEHHITSGDAENIASEENTNDAKTELWNLFEKLTEMYEIEKEAELEFHKILCHVGDNTSATHLSEFLHERKKECVKVFAEFDKIATVCEDHLQAEYRDFKKRQQQQISILETMLSEVEKYLAEVQEAGNKEIYMLKDSIANHVYDMARSWSNRINEIYDELNNEPSTMEVWNNCAGEITSKDIRMAFLEDQREMALLWKKAFEDIMMLSTELEKYRYSYTLSKSNMERSILWIQRNYKDDMPELTKLQRKVANVANKKEALEQELLKLEKLIGKEQAKAEDIKLQYKAKICAMEEINKQNKKQMLVKYRNVFEVKKSEILDLLQDILNGDKYIFQIILNIDWEPPNLSLLESEHSAEKIQEQKSETSENSESKHIKTLQEDEFAEAFRILASNRDLETLLNAVAENLGYILDFEWVNYAKQALEIKNEIKWIELFKVFKIDFARDLKDLKDHMMSYTTTNDAGETVIDKEGAVAGFLHFLELRRQQLSSSSEEKIPNELPSENYEKFIEKVTVTMPQTFIWDSVVRLLRNYRELLKSRGRLVGVKEDLEMQNSELDNCLQNYYNFDIPD